MNKRQGKMRMSLIFLVIFGVYFVVFTKPGTHFVIDVLSEIGQEKKAALSAEDGPLKLTGRLDPVTKVPLPTSIEQPSGIKHRNGIVYISTDQTEIFQLSNEFKSIAKPFSLSKAPSLLKQGTLEGIEVIDDILYAVGAYGAIQVWKKNRDSGWVRMADSKFNPEILSLGEELSGIVNTPSGQLAVSEEHQRLVNLTEGTSSEIDFGDFLKEKSTINELVFGGIAYQNKNIFILTENFTSVIIIDSESLTVKGVLGLETADAADLSIHEGMAYVVVDHNYNEEKTPVHVYDFQNVLENRSKAIQ